MRDLGRTHLDLIDLGTKRIEQNPLILLEFYVLNITLQLPLDHGFSMVNWDLWSIVLKVAWDWLAVHRVEAELDGEVQQLGFGFQMVTVRP